MERHGNTTHGHLRLPDIREFREGLNQKSIKLIALLFVHLYSIIYGEPIIHIDTKYNYAFKSGRGKVSSCSVMRCRVDKSFSLLTNLIPFCSPLSSQSSLSGISEDEGKNTKMKRSTRATRNVIGDSDEGGDDDGEVNESVASGVNDDEEEEEEEEADELEDDEEDEEEEETANRSRSSRSTRQRRNVPAPSKKTRDVPKRRAAATATGVQPVSARFGRLGLV